MAVFPEHLKEIGVSAKWLNGDYRDDLPLYAQLTPMGHQNIGRLALKDPWIFLEYINFNGGVRSFYPIHRDLLTHLTRTWELRMVLMPRGHFKSTVCSTLYVLWRIYCDPNIRIMVGCAGKELATGFVRQIMQYFEDPELNHYVWNNRPHIDGPLVPDMDRTGSTRKRNESTKNYGYEDGKSVWDTQADGRKVLWRANAIQVMRPKTMKEPTVFACSVGVVMTGWHYDLAIFDDLVTFRNSDTPFKAQKIQAWVDDITSVIDPRGLNGEGLGEETVVLGTRYYPWDLYAHYLGLDLETKEEREEYLETAADAPVYLIKKDIYGNGVDSCQYELGMEEIAGLTAEDGYICPKLMNPKRERKLRRKRRWFACQYLNLVLANEEQLLNWENVNHIHPMGIIREGKYIKVRVGTALETKATYVLPIIVVDPAASLSQSADYGVVCCGGVDEDLNLYVFDVKYGHWTPSTLASRIKEMMEKWSIKVVHIESSGTQVAIVNAIKDEWKRMNYVATVRHDQPRGDKKQRILERLEPLFERSAVWAMTWMSSVQELKAQVNMFPATGARDDFPDCLEKLVRIAKPVRVSDVEKRKARQRVGRGAVNNAKVNTKYGGVR